MTLILFKEDLFDTALLLAEQHVHLYLATSVEICVQ